MLTDTQLPFQFVLDKLWRLEYGEPLTPTLED